MKAEKKLLDIDNLVVIADTHGASKMGLIHPSGQKLKDGGTYKPSKMQLEIWRRWREFHDVWVPKFTRGEKHSLVVDGDVCDWDHHGTNTCFTKNCGTHIEVAKRFLAPEIEKAEHTFFVIGSEAHTGEQGDAEEALAEWAGCEMDETGRYARYELWIEVGGELCHIAHTIGTSSSVAYETTAVHKELIDAFTEAGMWNDRPPRFVLRAHRHRYCKTTIPSELGDAESIVLPAWQLKTPWFLRKARGRLSRSQLGGLVLRKGADGEVYERHRVWAKKRPKVVR